MLKKICFFSGTRAEYGILKPLLYKIKEEESFKLQFIVSGMHLSCEFGLTYREIEEDGFDIDDKIEILLSSDSAVALCKSMGLGLIGYSEVLNKLKPDMLVVLGDRFEVLVVVEVAMILNIPIVHLSGGEATFGVMDEAIRHSITKMSHLHFTTNENHRKRVIQLGEDPGTVFNYGSLCVDNILNLSLLSKQELEKKLNITFKQKNLLVTFHPVTLEKNTSEKYLNNLFEVLSTFDNIMIIFTKANADIYGRSINKMLEAYVKKMSKNIKLFDSLGSLYYLSLMQYVDAVVGNSSSGIVEAPSFKIGTINIGDRQEGRAQADSIINTKSSKESIRAAFKELYSNSFQEKLKNTKNLYGDGQAAQKITDKLKKYEYRDVLKKKFYKIL
ncbi:UDP-N-acetylglucosamine 2-epimerase (hydrolyzing) [bacterium]|jgi:GDP/UDP-N,N'-diacetylbacillosamine 2-epimerase (hydrolysing)|nr:UDP-N-acetylglucosamine 2-epimerase (hydrolyzing) [bacterium]